MSSETINVEDAETTRAMHDVFQRAADAVANGELSAAQTVHNDVHKRSKVNFLPFI